MIVILDMYVRKTKRHVARRMFVMLALLYCFLSTAEARIYDGEFVVRIVGGPKMAKMISEEMGFHYKGPVSDGLVAFVFVVSRLPKWATSPGFPNRTGRKVRV